MEESKEEKRKRLIKNILLRGYNSYSCSETMYQELRRSTGKEAFSASDVHTRTSLNFGSGPNREDKVLRILYNLQGSRTISDVENRNLCLQASNPLTTQDRDDFYDGCRFLESKLRERKMTQEEYLAHLKEEYLGCAFLDSWGIVGRSDFHEQRSLLQEIWRKNSGTTPEKESYDLWLKQRTEHYASLIREFKFEQNIPSFREGFSKKDLTQEQWEKYKEEHLTPERDNHKQKRFSGLKNFYRRFLPRDAK